MDESNKENIIKLSRNKEDNNKVDLFLENNHPDANLNVPDPYYGGESGFEHVLDLVEAASKALLKDIAKNAD